MVDRTERGRSSIWWRCTAIGAIIGAVVGGIVGLVVGLMAHPATAWFAVLELGYPAAVLGCVAGLFAAALVSAARWLDRKF